MNKNPESLDKENNFSHLDSSGKASMVNVSSKSIAHRQAIAKGQVKSTSEIIEAIENGFSKKGEVLAVSKIAGIMAAKKTSDIIPLCHQINLSHIDIIFDIIRENNAIEITSTVETYHKTGVEMEALIAVSTAALTIYDMCKSMGHDIIIGNIRLVSKTGGKSDYIAK